MFVYIGTSKNFYWKRPIGRRKLYYLDEYASDLRALPLWVQFMVRALRCRCEYAVKSKSVPSTLLRYTFAHSTVIYHRERNVSRRTSGTSQLSFLWSDRSWYIMMILYSLSLPYDVCTHLAGQWRFCYALLMFLLYQFSGGWVRNLELQNLEN